MTLPHLCSPAMFHNLLEVKRWKPMHLWILSVFWKLHAKCGRTSELQCRTNVYAINNFMKPGISCSEKYSKKYMYNCDLRDKIEAYRRDPHSFNRTKTQQLSKTRRSAFKAWVHSLIGDRTLFANLVRHGRWFTDNAFPIRTFWCKNHVVLEAPQQITIPVSNHHKEISIQFSRTPVHTIWSRRQYQLTPGKLPQRISENTETTFDEWMSWEVL